MDFLKKLDMLMEQKGLNKSSLSKACDIPYTTIDGWYKKGYEGVKLTTLKKLSAFFCTSLDFWANDEALESLLGTESSRAQSKGVKIPVLGRVVAGIPIDAVQDILDYEEITTQLAATGEFFALQVKGDSMEPRICEGDVLIVRQQSDAESGEIVIALINGNEATCKKLVKHEDGISLVSFNTKYEPMFFSNAQIIQKPVSIIGKVIENRQKYN